MLGLWMASLLLLAPVPVVGTRAPVLNGSKAIRICRPSPPSPSDDDASGSVPACLVIGDSVSLGYTGSAFGAPGSGGNLAHNFRGTCTVLHAPFSGDGGACDTRYGLQCADLWLGSTLSGAAAPKYSVIVFNFGLHDTNDKAFDEEARDEFVPVDEYGRNLVAFAKKIRTHQPQAQLAWLSSTPMHFDMHLNSNVRQYNERARKLLVAGGVVDAYLDLYTKIVGACGEPPYYASKLAPNVSRICHLINDNEEYHYNSAGWKLLAAAVGTEIKALLHKGPHSTGAVPEVQAAVVHCPDGKTACPSITSSCVADKFSSTKWGCCMAGPGATSCYDGFHCCAKGSECRANGTNPVSPLKPMLLNFSHVCVPA